MARPKPDMKRAVASIRCSTDRQDLSPDAQRETIRAWASREGATIVAWFEDLGVSGGDAIEDCPGLLEAIDALAAHGAGVLVVAKRDRLARDPIKAAMIESYVARVGAVVQSAAGEGNGDSPTDVLMRRIVDAFAEYEKLLIRARTKAALRVKRQRGELTGTAPIGWTATEGIRTADGKRYVQPPRLVADPLEQRAVQRIVELRREGVSWGGIVDTLTGEGIATRSGGRWHITSVRRVFAREQANGRTGEQAEA